MSKRQPQKLSYNEDENDKKVRRANAMGGSVLSIALALIVIILMAICSCAPNYYGARGYGSAEFEATSYIVIKITWGNVVYSGYATVVQDDEGYTINGGYYSNTWYSIEYITPE